MEVHTTMAGRALWIFIALKWVVIAIIEVFDGGGGGVWFGRSRHALPFEERVRLATGRARGRSNDGLAPPSAARGAMSSRALVIPGHLWKANEGLMWAPISSWQDRAREFLLPFDRIEHAEVAKLRRSIGVVIKTHDSEVWLRLRHVGPAEFASEFG